ncbi:hypothetical protein HQ325_13835 [Rhodococcus sp. BP-349]|uniref:hypothetical protein n=1 Tax=unclassified Rhodococcus (in: high G+C Gram-positive bacteria) TaxID=192944 RepID=UPI001C9A712D|nr:MULTISPECIES: hypothetical protein [unclassified Rhodococcus (in: high G+C Gram-positive bacteria)]MBY6539754.1 hypothetical protein [Rhodococcus sp. BP-363]MBY6543918.1 hypothetical protein [Rhodococcus sp. BP-369]MBY6563148.1 hypothetical protein [Rhodococcus sp. BP-370]MBY6577440.1 hypothetical protein [Rhodococcus sp. BP-364]MBY6586741.1 hypothetical protein [Rhodococcus sp. BP-358]
MPPARRRPPTGAPRVPAGSVRRPKVAGRSTAPAAGGDAIENETTSASTDAASTVDLSKSSADTAAVDDSPAVAGTPAVDSPATDSVVTETTETTAADDGAPAGRTAWWTPRTMLLAALAVVFAVIALLAVVRPGTSEVSNEAWVDTPATLEVTSAGRDALQTVFSYKFDTIDQDQAAARAVLNDERRGEYDSTAEQTKQGVIQTQTTTTATVTDIGVSLLDGDRAELLASMDIAATQDTVDQGTVQTPVSVTMERVDGKWLLATIDNR